MGEMVDLHPAEDVFQCNHNFPITSEYAGFPAKNPMVHDTLLAWKLANGALN